MARIGEFLGMHPDDLGVTVLSIYRAAANLAPRHPQTAQVVMTGLMRQLDLAGYPAEQAAQLVEQAHVRLVLSDAEELIID